MRFADLRHEYTSGFLTVVTAMLLVGAAMVSADTPHPEWAGAVGLRHWDLLSEIPWCTFPDDAFVLGAETGASSVLVSARWREMHVRSFDEKLQEWRYELRYLEEFDRRISLALDAGLEVAFNVGASVPPWAMDSEAPGSDENCEFWFSCDGICDCQTGENCGCSQPPLVADYYYDFVYTLLDRWYVHDISAVEVWNEPNYCWFWASEWIQCSGSDPLQEWIRLIVEPCWRAINDINSTHGTNIQLVGPAFGNNFQADDACSGFIQWADPTKDYFDIYSTHHVQEGAVDTFALFNAVGGCADWNTSYGGDKPFWSTEYSTSSSLSDDGNDPRYHGEIDQAADYIQAIESANVNDPPIDRVFLAPWRDSPPTEPGSGLFESCARHNRPKKSFWDVRDLLVTGVAIARDTFSNNLTDRVEGDLLNDSLMELGGLTWIADPTVVIGISEATNAGSGHHIGGVPFAPADHGSIVFVQGDVVANWSKSVGVGFTESATGGFWYDGLLVGRLYGQSGELTYKILMQDPATGVLGDPVYSSSIQGSEHARPYRFKLQYDQCLNTVDAWFGENQVVSGYPLDGFRPEIKYAGFHMNNTGQQGAGAVMTLDSFMLDAPDEPLGRPKVLEHPQDMGVDAGGTTQLEVSASGAAPLGYQWQFDGGDISDGPHYSGTNTTTLTVTNATAAETGRYRCIVSNSSCTFGIASRDAELTVQEAFNGPHFLPARIEAEDYDVGGEGIAYHDTQTGNQCQPPAGYRSDDVDIQTTSDPQGGMYNVGYIFDGEWLEYTVDFTMTGCYTIEARVAAPLGGGFHLEDEYGNQIGTPVDFLPTGGSQDWVTVNTCGYFHAGQEVIRLVADQDFWNLNWVEPTYKRSTPCLMSDCIEIIR